MASSNEFSKISTELFFWKSQDFKLYGCECVSILCPMSIALFVLHDQPHEKNIFSLKQTVYLA